MSAAVETMTYVGEEPWHGLGVKLESATIDPEDIVAKTELNFTCSAHELKSDIQESIPSWYGIYRDDKNTLLGVIHRSNPMIVQNIDQFNSIAPIYGNKVTFETAASLSGGATVFGCFKVAEQYKCLDDDIDHYFVIVNDHLKPDGRITVLNTPIRVVCKNTLDAALTNNSARVRIPIVPGETMNESIIDKILESAGTSIASLDDSANKLVSVKTDPSYLSKVEDMLFPFQYVDGQVADTHANDKIQMERDTFLKCLDVDNLQNYKGTAWAVYNALADYEQHYYSNPDKIYDLSYRMSKIKGVTVSVESAKANKFLTFAEKLAA